MLIFYLLTLFSIIIYIIFFKQINITFFFYFFKFKLILVVTGVNNSVWSRFLSKNNKCVQIKCHEVPANFARSTLRREEFLEIQQALGCTGDCTPFNQYVKTVLWRRPNTETSQHGNASKKKRKPLKNRFFETFPQFLQEKRKSLKTQFLRCFLFFFEAFPQNF